MWFAASYKRGEHGTIKANPNDSLTTKLGDPQWAEFYKEISIEDVRSVLDLNAIFSEHKIEYSEDEAAIYFWGVKK